MKLCSSDNHYTTAQKSPIGPYLHAQKPYGARPANNTGHDYLVLVQFNLVDTYFYFRQSLLPFFSYLRVVHAADIKICINYLQVVRFLLNTFCPVQWCVA